MLKEKIKEYCKLKNLSLADFAMFIGVNSRTLYKYMNGTGGVSRKRMDIIILFTDGFIMPEHFSRIPARKLKKLRGK